MKMRDLMNLLTEGAESEWTVIRPATADVTGDDAPAMMDEFGAHDLVGRVPADEGDSFSRDILTYMNPDKTVKVVLYPTYDGGNGAHYSVTVYQRG